MIIAHARNLHSEHMYSLERIGQEFLVGFLKESEKIIVAHTRDSILKEAKARVVTVANGVLGYKANRPEEELDSVLLPVSTIYVMLEEICGVRKG